MLIYGLQRNDSDFGTLYFHLANAIYYLNIKVANVPLP